VASEIPSSRQTSFTVRPPSTCFNVLTICVSVNLLFLIQGLLTASLPEDLQLSMERIQGDLTRRRRFKKRYRPAVPDLLLQPIRPNQAWSADFMSDALYDGRAFRTFNVIDDYNREALRIEVDVSLTAERVIRVLDQLLTIRGRPERLRVDHGPEFTSAVFAAWCESHGVELEFIQPGKPAQNAFIERFNGSYRDAVLDAWVFTDLEQVRHETERWLKDYNTVRPHESLGDISPMEFLNDRGHAEFSSYGWT
jgi:putative transposase